MALIQAPRTKSNIVELAKRDAKVSFRQAVAAKLGDMKGFRMLGSDVLVATYVATEKTAGGIIRPETSIHEDRWQGKVGLVLMMGPSAFKYDGQFPYEGEAPKIGDYVMFHTADGRELFIGGTSCKIIYSQLIRMVTPDPDEIY